MNKINNLLLKPFSSLPYEEQIEIKMLGRPLPDMKITTKQKERVRQFSPAIYLKNKWICGCEFNNAFFCFPCVLYGGETIWTKTGIKDLVHIYSKMSTHDKSKKHMNNVFNLSMLDKYNIIKQLNSTYIQDITKHNEQVDKNRQVLNLIINCIRFCGALELALKGQKESEQLTNKGVFKELINFSSQLDMALRYHVEESSVFKEASKDTQNDLLECMLRICQEEIAKEIKNADFVALIADETTDIACEFQLVLIFRYIVNDKPVERFWRFLNLDGHDALSISNCILAEIDQIISETPEKLIGQSYDGASIMSGGLNGVQRIRDKYLNAKFVHCYAHQINSIIASVASINKHTRIFFAHLSGICSFFSNSPQRTRILDEMVQKGLPSASQTKWDFYSRGINNLYVYRRELIEVMETLETTEDIKLRSTIEQAGAYKIRLQDNEFIFWLTIFHKIMPHVDIIFRQLQKSLTNPDKVKKSIQSFKSNIEKIRNDIDDIISNINESADYCPPTKHRRTDTHETWKSEALQICDLIIVQIKARFDFTGHLIAANLFIVDEFTNFQNKFPTKYLDEVIQAFPFLDKNRLKTELQVLYCREELQSISGVVPLLSLICNNDLQSTFTETVKLLKILITIPMSTSETERCFSMAKRIKTFLGNTMKEDNLSALGMLSVEKAFINNIDNFNKKVIDLFASKEHRRMDFVYQEI